MKLKIGQKVRKLRKERKMTQAQLAGDTITRNMLSLIENDAASPSLQTLQYLSEKLEVSPAYFFDSEGIITEGLIAHHNEEIKEAYFNKKYEKAAELFDRYYGVKTKYLTDEILLIAAESTMWTGKQKILKGAFESGSEFLTRSRDYCSRCPYNTEWIEAHIYLYESIVENTDCPIQALDKDYSFKIRRTTDSELYNYLYAIRLLDDGKGDDAAHFLKHNRLIDAGHKDHINAKFILLSDSQLLKRQALESLTDMIKRAPTYALDAISRYLILKDIEYAARSIDNYEMAYKYASMRLKIISDMRD